VFTVGIIGAGPMGQKRAKAVAAHRSSRLSVICDIDLKKAQAAAREYNCFAAQDSSEVVRDGLIDIVVVSTTNDQLAGVSVAALNNKKHVLCEKPFGRNIEEARRICEAAAKNACRVKAGFNHRFYPAIRKAYELCAKGAIGELMYIRAVYGHGGRPGYAREWRMDPRLSGGGELIDQGAHLIDLFRWFMGEFNEAFAANMNFFWRGGGAEDNSFIILRTKDGKAASAHASTTQWRNRFLFEVFGKGGYLIVTGLGRSYGPQRLIYGKRTALGKRPVEKIFSFPGEDPSWGLEWGDFIEAIRKGRQPLADGRDGYKAHEILAALYASAKKKRIVRVEEGLWRIKGL